MNNYTISMSAEGAEPLSYQWLHDGTIISGDQAQGYPGFNSSIPTISKNESRYGGNYACEVRDCDDKCLLSDEVKYAW